MAYLKDEIPADIAEVLCQAEAQADECWRALHLRHYPADLAIWAVLTGGIRMVEGEQATRGSNTPHFDSILANLGRLLAVAVKWAIGHGQPPADAPRRGQENCRRPSIKHWRWRRITAILRCAFRDSIRAGMRRTCSRRP